MNLKKISSSNYCQLIFLKQNSTKLFYRKTNGPCHPGLKKAEQSLEDQIYSILRKKRIISNIR